MSTSDPAPAKGGKQTVVKPERPDEEKFKAEEAKLEKALKEAQDKTVSIQEKLNNRSSNKDSPTAKRLQEIKAEQDEIKAKQAGSKNSFAQVQERRKKIDEQVKSRIAELNAAKGKLSFKSVEEIDREIQRLQKQVDTGTMKLVEEKKNLNEITNLNKQRKNFAGFEQQQKAIDDLKAQSAEQSKQLNDPERKALNDRFTALKNEADELYGQSRSAQKDQNAIWEERNKARTVQNEKFAALRKLRDEYHGALREAKNYEREARKIRNEKYKAEQDAYHAQKRKQNAATKLEEASAPAYSNEIIIAEGLIRYFDPSALPAKTEAAPSKFAASAGGRAVDTKGFEGMKVAKKDDEDYFQGTGGKKGKKGKTTTAATKYSLDIGTIDELGKVGVNPPSSQAEVPGVVEKLKEKLAHWKSDQKRATDENIAKAQKEIDRLEAEEANGGSRDAATKPAQANQGVNGKPSAEAELQQEKDADADVAAELEKAKIEDASETS
ncbi:hypothetical protein EJ05DRAFT_436028 [Pseudovirgaria hyperparasitica]|uniref:Nuclear segregation protein n=1 Tax=Pseudovirgaria hyperparasitica TaxID=470096 RepID=A0A6A6WDT3_9PEZI|nr:uncharacterized protein EJ05DRAFT_436028 [Pseudovirgaria hyperparasitica]KAF2760140.1 hypothetical protein EJ05DRAFT_436028 [Pseudovirgaria hyperparasitica]